MFVLTRMTAGARVGAWRAGGKWSLRVGDTASCQCGYSRRTCVPDVDDKRATILITRESDLREEAYQQGNYCKVMPNANPEANRKNGH